MEVLLRRAGDVNHLMVRLTKNQGTNVLHSTLPARNIARSRNKKGSFLTKEAALGNQRISRKWDRLESTTTAAAPTIVPAVAKSANAAEATVILFSFH